MGFLALNKIQNPSALAVNTIDEIAIVIVVGLLVWLFVSKW